MKPICIIAARGGSKGVPGKNIRIVNSKPLIAHTILKAIKSKLFSHVIVSTEDKKIALVSKKYGAEVPFIRPKKYAIDTASLDDVLYHAVKKLYSLGYNFETVVNLDCTVPFLRIKDIKGVVKLLKKKKCHFVVGVYRQHLNPYFNIMEKNKNGYLQLSKKLKERPKSIIELAENAEFYALCRPIPLNTKASKMLDASSIRVHKKT